MRKQIPVPEQNGFEMIGRLCIAGLAISGIGALMETYINSQPIPTPDEQIKQAQKNHEETIKMKAQPTPQPENKSKWMDPAEHTVPLDIRTDR
jgi:hypothetical protein